MVCGDEIGRAGREEEGGGGVRRTSDSKCVDLGSSVIDMSGTIIPESSMSVSHPANPCNH